MTTKWITTLLIWFIAFQVGRLLQAKARYWRERAKEKHD